MLYGTTPGPTTISGGFTGGYLLFPFNDDENLHDGGVINTRNYLGDFARFMGARNAGQRQCSPCPRLARDHECRTPLAVRCPRRHRFGSRLRRSAARLLRARRAGVRSAFGARRQRHPGASAADTPGGTEHRHYDAGSFQIWRKGRWLTRESAGYSDQIARLRRHRQRRHRTPAGAQHVAVRGLEHRALGRRGPHRDPARRRPRRATRAACPQ